MSEKRPSPIRALKDPARILILNQNWLGDVLFSTPAIRAIRRRFPKSHLSCLAPKRVSDALLRNPHLNETLSYDERAALLTLFEPLRVWAMLRKRRFDAVILFHRSRSKAFLAMAAGIRLRVGFARGGRDWLLTEAIAPPEGRPHKIDAFLHLLKEAGIPSDGRWPELVPSKADEAGLNALLASRGVSADEPLAVVHAGGNWELKRWPPEYFSRWIDLFRRAKKWKIVLCGTASEEMLARSIAEKFTDGGVVSVCGKTSLGELAALMKRARIVLSNDSGPIHVAAAQRAPILGLFGPTSPRETGPVSEGPVRILWKDVGCRVPCYFRSCNKRACMEFLTPEEVLERSEELLAL